MLHLMGVKGELGRGRVLVEDGYAMVEPVGVPGAGQEAEVPFPTPGFHFLGGPPLDVLVVHLGPLPPPYRPPGTLPLPDIVLQADAPALPAGD